MAQQHPPTELTAEQQLCAAKFRMVLGKYRLNPKEDTSPESLKQGFIDTCPCKSDPVYDLLVNGEFDKDFAGLFGHY